MSEHAEHHHEHVGAGALAAEADGHAGHTPEEIRAETRVYLIVFGCLAALTAATVAVSYLRLEMHEAVIVALIIASIKGFLVAGYFMHLLSERKLILSVLVLTAMFFIFLIGLPLWHHHDVFGK
jgi:cytochrome c oxidase subunit 4